VNELDDILARSRAADAFKAAIKSFCETGGAPDHIRVDGFAPPVKVRRVLAHVLESEPELPIERVAVRGRSGCSDFAGTVHVHTTAGTRAFEFVWDCCWRAEQEGWVDYFGFPDQARAAREFDWRCFQRWQPI